MIQDRIRQIAAGRSGRGKTITLSDAECAELDAVTGLNPSVTEDDLATMFDLLAQRISGQNADRSGIPAALIAFYDAKAERDMDMLSLAHAMGSDIRSGCEGCTCRC